MQNRFVSVSDRASTGVYEDKGIPTLQEWLTRVISSPFTLETRLIADEQMKLKKHCLIWLITKAAT
jgi:molybdopterin adenylyltransferase